MKKYGGNKKWIGKYFRVKWGGKNYMICKCEKFEKDQFYFKTELRTFIHYGKDWVKKSMKKKDICLSTKQKYDDWHEEQKLFKQMRKHLDK
jgi:hypothetical protein